MSQKYSIRVISLASLFVAIYSLFFSGHPISVDEQLYLTATRNISVLGKLSAEQLSGSIRLAGSYHGVEPAHPALASLWYKIFSSSDFVSWQVLYLLPIFYTAFSCVLLYLIAVRLGYEDKIGVILAILYGLSTMAFPYAKTFFREPLIVFLISGSWFAFLNFEHPKRHIRLIAFVSFFVFITLLILTKIPYLVVPITFFYIWIAKIEKTSKSRLYDNVIKATLLLGFFVSVFLFTTRNFTDQNIFYRFSGALFRDAINIILFAPHTHFFEVVLGSLFSPLKGLIFYSPIILLGAYAMIRSWGKNKELFILPFVVLATLLLAQALAHDDEWWTTPWGNRYLLPVIPLFLIASLPALDEIMHLGKNAYFILGSFFLTGFFIQLPAVLFNSSRFATMSYASTPTSFSEYLWNFSAMPIFLQWNMAKIPLYDLMIWRTFSVEPFLGLIFVLTVAVLFFLSLYWLFFSQNFKAPWSPFITSTILIVFLFGIMLKIGVSDPVYNVKANLPLCDFIEANIEPNDILIVDSYPEPIWYFLSAHECGRGVWYSLPYDYANDKTSLAYEHAQNLLADLLDDRKARVWFVSDEADYSSSALREEVITENNYHFVDELHYPFAIITLYIRK